MNFTLEKLFEALKPIKYFVKEREEYSSININSKKCKKGSIFFALKGERVDGHDYIKNAFENGASLAITDREVDHPYIMVSDTKDALLELLNYYLKTSNFIKIAITGSVGKTTTRYFLKQMIGDLAVTTPKNYNTELSVPLILNYINKRTKYLIFEFGLQKKGDISLLSSVVKPDISIVTKVSNVHLQYFNSFQEIINEKLSILQYTSKFSLLDKGLEKYANFSNIEFVDFDKRSMSLSINFDFKYDINRKIYLPNIPSIFEPNLIAALKVCKYLSIPFKNLNLNLRLPEKRFELKKCNDFTIISDYYNSNPYSLRKALKYIHVLKSKRKIVVLGDMLELGKDSIKEHRSLRPLLKQFDLVILYGNLVQYIGIGYWFNDKSNAIEFLLKNLKKNDLIFIKGSRSMKMESFEEAIKCK